MSHSEVYSAISAVVPCRHLAWPADGAPPLPWAVYYQGEPDTGFFADDSNFALDRQWTVELYENERDASLEESVQSAIAEAFGPWTRYEERLDEENCVMVVYTFTDID